MALLFKLKTTAATLLLSFTLSTLATGDDPAAFLKVASSASGVVGPTCMNGWKNTQGQCIPFMSSADLASCQGIVVGVNQKLKGLSVQQEGRKPIDMGSFSGFFGVAAQMSSYSLTDGVSGGQTTTSQLASSVQQQQKLAQSMPNSPVVDPLNLETTGAWNFICLPKPTQSQSPDALGIKIMPMTLLALQNSLTNGFCKGLYMSSIDGVVSCMKCDPSSMPVKSLVYNSRVCVLFAELVNYKFLLRSRTNPVDYIYLHDADPASTTSGSSSIANATTNYAGIQVLSKYKDAQSIDMSGDKREIFRIQVSGQNTFAFKSVYGNACLSSFTGQDNQLHPIPFLSCNAMVDSSLFTYNEVSGALVPPSGNVQNYQRANDQKVYQAASSATAQSSGGFFSLQLDLVSDFNRESDVISAAF